MAQGGDATSTAVAASPGILGPEGNEERKTISLSICWAPASTWLGALGQTGGDVRLEVFKGPGPVLAAEADDGLPEVALVFGSVEFAVSLDDRHHF